MGFAVTASAPRDAVMRKHGLQAGQLLVLTKPLGTGVLLAGEMRGAAKGVWVAGALQSMLLSNRQAGLLLKAAGAAACTDVTGFGLAGHLAEMLRPSGLGAELWLDQLPLLAGAAECVAKGIFSSLYPENVRLRHAVGCRADAQRHPSFPLLFDPQTAGGLLAGLEAGQLEACLAQLQAAGYTAAVVGRVVSLDAEDFPIAVLPARPAAC